MIDCCVTGLRLMHRPLATSVFVHPEFYTLSLQDAAHKVTAMFNDTTPLDKSVFRLCIAVVLRHYGLLHPDVFTPPYVPRKLDEMEAVDFAEEVAAAFQIQTWASTQIRVQVAELTDCTCRAIMEGVTHDSTSFVVAAINSLPTSLSQQLYSWTETASRLSQSLDDMAFSHEDIGHIIRVLLHLVALDQPQDEEPIETYSLMDSRAERLIRDRPALFKSVSDICGHPAFSPSERRMLKLLTQRAPKIILKPIESPLVDNGHLSTRLAELRAQKGVIPHAKV